MDPPRSRHRQWCCLIAVWLVSLNTSWSAESLDSLQKTVADLSRVRTETARLESEWRWQNQTLAATVEAWKMRADALEQQQIIIDARTGAQRQEINTLAAQAEVSRTRLHEADQQLRAIAEELVAMRAWLPPRLSHALELPYRSLADDALAPGERLQHLSTIWTRCTQFNGVITCDTETLVLGNDAPPRLLDVIYWGLSHGYALDRVRQIAYVGRPETDGWKWREAPTITAAVAKLMAIYRDQADPEFVSVPAQVAAPFTVADQ